MLECNICQTNGECLAIHSVWGGAAPHSLTFSKGLERFMSVKLISVLCWVGDCSKNEAFMGC